MQLRSRLLIAAVFAVAVAGARYAIAPTASNDLYWPLCHAREFLAGRDPYGAACQVLNPATGGLWPPNPMTTAFLVMPFTPLADPVAAAAITGLLFGLAAFAIVSTGTPWRLAVLLSWPAFYCLYYAQLPPLLLAVTLLPALMPLGLAKPQLLIPAFLVSFSWRRAGACLAFVALTLLFDPLWPVRFLAQARSYDGYIPLFTLAGPALLLLALFWRDRDARLLLLCGLMPQRLYHDLLLMSAALRTRQEALIWTGASWAVVFLVGPALMQTLVGPLTYAVAAGILFARLRSRRAPTAAPRRGITSPTPQAQPLKG